MASSGRQLSAARLNIPAGMQPHAGSRAVTAEKRILQMLKKSRSVSSLTSTISKIGPYCLTSISSAERRSLC